MVRLSTFTALEFIPDWETKILQAANVARPNKEEKQHRSCLQEAERVVPETVRLGSSQTWGEWGKLGRTPVT